MWRPGWVYARAGAKCGTYRAVSRTSKQQRRLAQPGSVPARLTGACEAWQGSDDQSLVDYTSLRHSLHGTIVQVCLDHWRCRTRLLHAYLRACSWAQVGRGSFLLDAAGAN